MASSIGKRKYIGFENPSLSIKNIRKDLKMAAFEKRIVEIDGLRAIAMTMVIAQHCGLLPFGWTGVWLFYVISGFVITRGFLAEDDAVHGIRRRFAVFMLRRCFRIVPVYLLYLALNAVLLVTLNDFGHLRDLLYLGTFTFNWYMIFGYNPETPGWSAFGHLWTLSVEEQFYLFFPWIALVVPVRSRVPITLCLIILGPVIRYLYAEAVAPLRNDPEWTAFAVYASSICHFDAFLLGSLIARFEPNLRDKPHISTILSAIAIILVVVYAAIYVGINRSLGATGIDAFRNVISGVLFGQHREVFVYIIIDLFACAVLIHAILQRSFSSILASRVFVVVGRISYGGYLFHALLLWGLRYVLEIHFRELPISERVLYFAAVWIATITVAYTSFQWFETPIARWARARFIDHRVSKVERGTAKLVSSGSVLLKE